MKSLFESLNSQNEIIIVNEKNVTGDFRHKFKTVIFQSSIEGFIKTIEEAKINSKKGPLKREVVRIISPGTLTEDNLLDSKANNFLARDCFGSGSVGSSPAETTIRKDGRVGLLHRS